MKVYLYTYAYENNSEFIFDKQFIKDVYSNSVMNSFGAVSLGNNGSNMSPTRILADEYETIRLIDKKGFSQEECSRFMNVARTTIQNVYNSARKKLAEALVNGQALYISGGDYTICSKRELHSLCADCKAHNIE